MPAGTIETIHAVIALVRAVRPSSVLDVGATFGRWGTLLRECMEAPEEGPTCDGRIRIDGLEVGPSADDAERPLYDAVHCGDIREATPGRRYDLAIACDVLERLPREEGLALFEGLADRADACIVAVPLENRRAADTDERNGGESSRSAWRSEDFDSTWKHLALPTAGGGKVGLFFRGEAFETREAVAQQERLRGRARGEASASEAERELTRIKRSPSYRLACRIAWLLTPVKRLLGRKPARPKPRPSEAQARTPDYTERFIPPERLARFHGSLRHMATVHPRFSLVPSREKPGAYGICWDGRALAQTAPLGEVADSAGGDVILVGTGPSVQQVDTALLAKRPCVGVNGAIALFEKAGTTPAYYTITTYDFFHNRFEMVAEILRSGARCFFPFWGLSVIAERAPDLLAKASLHLIEEVNRPYGRPQYPLHVCDEWIRLEPAFVHHPGHSRKGGKVGFSRDLARGIFHGENILYTALQVAYYIGFRRFFILGMDLNYSGPKPRFYETQGDTRPTWIDESFERSIVPCFEIVHNLCKAGKMEVYNVSPASRLPGRLVPKITPAEMAAMLAEE